MDIYNQLLSEFEQGKQKRDNGEEVNTLELMFIGYALDAVDVAKNVFNIDLDFTERSIENTETILDRLNKTIEIDKPSQDLILSYAKAFTGYIGQVMRFKWGGEWRDEGEYEINNGPGLRIKDQDLFLLSKVYRRITNGREDNVWHFYQVIRDSIEGTNNLKEVKVEELSAKNTKNWFRKLFGR